MIAKLHPINEHTKAWAGFLISKVLIFTLSSEGYITNSLGIAQYAMAMIVGVSATVESTN